MCNGCGMVRHWCITVVILILFSVLGTASQSSPSSIIGTAARLLSSAVSSDSLEFNILHTSDLHSYFEGVGPDTISHEARGHFARLKYTITRLQEKLNPFATLTVDAGDWNSGTLFHLLQVSYMYPDLVPEFQFLNDCNYDATVLGNHEFDGNENALNDMIQKANRNGIQLPILSGNILFDEGCELGKHYYENCNVTYIPTRAAQKATGQYVPTCPSAPSTDGTYLTPYILRELSSGPNSNRSVKVALLGVFSINSAQTSAISRKCTHFYGSRAGANFGELVKSVKDRIIEIREKHNPDVLVVLNHSGEPEDERLVRALQRWDTNALDVHISSHTHSIYLKKIKDTVLHQAGPYGINLGLLQFSFQFSTRKLSLLNEHVHIPDYFQIDSSISSEDLLPPRIPINSAIPYDADMLSRITRYKRVIDTNFLSQLEFSYDSELGNLEDKPDSILRVAELISDTLLEELNLELIEKKKTCGHNNTDRPVDFFMMPPSGVRTEFFAENGTSLQFSDMFRIMGIGALNKNITAHYPPGIRVAHFYLSKKHVRQTIVGTEFAARFINEMMALSYSSNLSYRMRRFGIPLYNLFDIRINGVPLDEIKHEYIHVAAPSYAVSFMKLTSKFSKGLLSFDLRDRFGRVIENPFLSDHQDYIYLSRKLQKMTAMKVKQQEQQQKLKEGENSPDLSPK